MPVYTITAPNGRQYRMTGPKGLSLEAQINHVLGFDPEAGLAPPPPQKGAMAALQGAGENWLASTKAGLKGAYDPQGAAEEVLAAQKAIGQKYDPETGLKRIGDAYDKDGLIAAGKEAFGQVPALGAQMAPSLAAGWAGAKAGARFGLPGVIGGGAVGALGGGTAANVPAMIGGNLAAQQEETPGEVSYGRAALTAIPQAALETAGPLLFMGKSIAAKLFGADVANMVRKLGPEAAEEMAKRRLLATAGRGGVKGALGEGGVEAMQEALERLQAGKSVLDEEALMSYAEAAYAGGSPGAALGAVGHTIDRSGAIADVKAKAQEAEALGAQKAAEDMAAAEQAAAEALEAEKSKPAYAAKVFAQYTEYETKLREMTARRAELQEEGTDAGTLAAEELGDEIKAYRESSKPLLSEYNKYGRPLGDALKAQANAAGEAAPEGAEAEADPDTAAQIEDLRAQIAEHEEALPTMQERQREIRGTGKSAAITQGAEAIKQRMASLKAATAALNKLDPTFKQEREREKQQAAERQAQQEAGAAREQAILSLDPVKARKQINELKAKQLGAKTDATSIAAAAEHEHMQSLLDEYERRQQDKDIERGSAEWRNKQLVRDQAAGQPLRLPAPPELLRLPAPVPPTMDEAFNRAFATKERVAAFDSLLQDGDEDAVMLRIAMRGKMTGEGAPIVEHLLNLPEDTRPDAARALQRYGKSVKEALYEGRDRAREARNNDLAREFSDAIREIAAMEQMDDDIGPGRAHYRPEFYNITSRLFPNLLRGARETLGMPTKPGTAEGKRGAAALEYQVLQDLERRLGGVEHKSHTAAMEAVAKEGRVYGEPPAREPTGRVVRGQRPEGTTVERTVAQRERDAEKAAEPAQGFLFEPEAAPEATADTPRQLLRQRIDKLLAMQRVPDAPPLLTQARKMLEHAADVLGPVENPETVAQLAETLAASKNKRTRAKATPVPVTVSQRVLETIEDMVRNAERGVGINTNAAAGEKAQNTGGTLRERLDAVRKAPSLQDKPMAQAMLTRMAERLDAGNLPDKVLVGISRQVASLEKGLGIEGDRTITMRPKGEERTVAGESVRTVHAGPALPSDVGPQQTAALLRTGDEATTVREGRVGRVRPQALEREEIGSAGKDEMSQPDMFDVMAIGRTTPERFQQALDTGALPSKRAALAADRLVKDTSKMLATVRMHAVRLRAQIIEADAARKRLEAIAKTPGAGARLEAESAKGRDDAVEALYKLRPVADRYAADAASAQKALDNIDAQQLSRRAYKAAVKGLRNRIEHQTAGAAKHAEEIARLQGRIATYDAEALGLPAIAARREELAADLAAMLEAQRGVVADLQTRKQAAKKAHERAGTVAEKAGTLRVPETGPEPMNPGFQAGVQKIADRKRAESTAAAQEAAAAASAEAEAARNRAHEPTEAERRAAAARTSATTYAKGKPETVTQVQRLTEEQRGVRARITGDATEEARKATDAADEAIARAVKTPGVERTALQEILKRVQTKVRPRSFSTRLGELDRELDAVEDGLRALRASNPGGMLSGKWQERHDADTKEQAALEEKLGDTKSAAERAALMQQIEGLGRKIVEHNKHRTPIEDSNTYRELKKREMLATFESEMLKAHRTALRVAEEGTESYEPAARTPVNVAQVSREDVTNALALTEDAKKARGRAEKAVAKANKLEKASPGTEEATKARASADKAVAKATALIAEAKAARTKAGMAAPAVEPAVKLAGAAVTRMDVFKAMKKQKTRYQSKGGLEQNEQQQEAKALEKEVRKEVAKALMAARKAKEAAGKPRKLTVLQQEKVTQEVLDRMTKAEPAKLGALWDAAAVASPIAKEIRETRARSTGWDAMLQLSQEYSATYVPPKEVKPPVKELKKEAAEATAEAKEAADVAAKLAKEQPAAKPATKAQAKRDALVLSEWQSQRVEDVRGDFVGPMLPKVVSDMYDKSTQTPMSEADMRLVHEGDLAGLLDSLAKNASSPVLRDVAQKLKALARGVGLEIDSTLKDAAQYDPATNTVSIHPLHLMNENVLHEVVHAATLRALVVPVSTLTQEQRNARAALENMLSRLQQDPAFAKEYGAKNIGEFAAEVMTNQALRDKLDGKPGLWARIKRAVLQMLGIKQPASAEASALVEKLFQPAQTFTSAELQAMEAALGSTIAPAAARQSFTDMITAEPTKGGLRGMIERIWSDPNKGLAFEQTFVDQRAGILKALSKGEQMVYQQAEYYLRKADARMAQVYAVLQHGPAYLKKDAKGYRSIEAGNGPSAKQLFEEIGKLPGTDTAKKFAQAQSYMVAQRAANKGWHTLGFDTAPALRAAAAVEMAQINANPALKRQLEAIRTMYNKYNNGMVQFLADSGSISKDTASKLLKDGDYVPFYRAPDAISGTAELVLGDTHLRVGDIRKQPYLHTLKGDTNSKLLPLNEAIMRNTTMLTNMGLNNLATKDVAYALQRMGKGRGPKGKDGKATDINAIHSGNGPAGADIVKFKQEPDVGETGEHAGERWVRIVSDGTAFEGISPEMLVQSLEGTHHVMTGIGKIGQWFGDVLRSGVTRNPAYVLKQLLRDPHAAAFTAGTSRGALGATMQTMREFVAQSRGSTATGEAMLRKGITQSGIFSGDPDDMGKFALQLAQGEQSAYVRLKSMADRAAMRADAATRAQVYDDALKATGSEMRAELAAMEMMNFSKRGNNPWVQHASRLIPFMNAQIQSLNVLAKAWRGNSSLQEKMQIREKFRRRAMGLAAFSFVYALAMEDNDEYKKASAAERLSNFFVPYPGGTLKIPIPYEVGLLFKAVPEAAARAMTQGLSAADTKALLVALLHSIPGTSNMFIAPQAIKGVAEVALNKRLYDLSPIDPESQKSLAPSQRYGDRTTELAKLVSSMLPDWVNISPRKVEHLVGAYLGSMPVAVETLVEDFLSDKSGGPERKMSEMPVIGSFFGDAHGTKGVAEDIYGAADDYAQAAATYKHYIEEGQYDKAAAFAKDNRATLAKKEISASAKKFMTEMREQRKQIAASPTMSPPEKRKRIDDLDDFIHTQGDAFRKALR